MKAVVKYRGHRAEYRITAEGGGIYNAVLEQFDGSVHDIPSPNITFTKAVRQWIGSTLDLPLIQKLGKVVELTYEFNRSFEQRSGGANREE